MLSSIILAAGRGTRMRTSLPKPLHPVCGLPMLAHLLRRATETGSKKNIVIAGHGIDLLKKYFTDTDHVGARHAVSLHIILQKEQLGSGHAVHQAARAMSSINGSVLVLYCDTPLIQTATLRALVNDHRRNKTDCTLLSVDNPEPAGYGRIKRDAEGNVERIVEESTATPEEKSICEINVGCYVFNARKLFLALKQVKRSPVKKEYFLTDVIGILSAEGRVGSVKTTDLDETLGVNTLKDLSRIRKIMQKRVCEGWMALGVDIRDPKSTFIDSDVKIGQDTVLEPHTVIQEGSRIGNGCRIGPFARIRGASSIGSQSVIGNFVEVVRSQIGHSTQVKHLSYLGDARVGDFVNVGAGTVTANYDGKTKHRTVIRDKAQIGSGTLLVAPVTVGRGAKTGAGAVLTKGTRVRDGKVYVGVPARELKK